MRNPELVPSTDHLQRHSDNAKSRGDRARFDDILVIEDEAFDADLVTALAIRTVLERLPEHERVVMELSFLEDRGSADVGRRLGISAGAVRVTKSRAIKHLRDLFGVNGTR